MNELLAPLGYQVEYDGSYVYGIYKQLILIDGSLSDGIRSGAALGYYQSAMQMGIVSFDSTTNSLFYKSYLWKFYCEWTA